VGDERCAERLLLALGLEALFGTTSFLGKSSLLRILSPRLTTKSREARLQNVIFHLFH